MTIWMISDTHFGEQPARRCNASGMAPAELDALIVRLWRERVAADDTVWHLGDIGKAWRTLLDLPGEKYLVLAHASDRRAAIAKSDAFISIREQAHLDHNGQSYLLVHDPDPLPDDPTIPVIHGHHHYRSPSPGCWSACVDHIGWGPIAIDALLEREL